MAQLTGDNSGQGTAGVLGTNNDVGGEGVRGFSQLGYGVHGLNDGGNGSPPSVGTGVWGESINGYGVFGSSTNQDGINGSTSGNGSSGVAGWNSGSGHGVWGGSVGGEGVHGETASQMAGVSGVNNGTDTTKLNPGVWGESKHGEGVHGNSHSLYAGVTGSNDGTGGLAPGIWGVSTNGEGVHAETHSLTFAAVSANQLNPNGTGDGVYAENQGKGHGVFATSKQWEGVHAETASATAAAIVGIQTNPQGTGAGIYGESRGPGPAAFFKGNVLVNGDIFLNNADCAEDFTVSDHYTAEPGTVMVIGDGDALCPSEAAYDKRVAGVISGAGDFKPGLILDRQQAQEGRRPVALMGKVYCKVDAEPAPIAVGDLLTTSDTPGYAMKAIDPQKAFGTVIGKALRPLDGGQGLIPILVALQ